MLDLYESKISLKKVVNRENGLNLQLIAWILRFC